MEDLTEARFDAGSGSNELQVACEHMTRKLIDGVRHGFFEMNIKVEMTQSKKRSITVVSGKSDRFVV